MNRSVQRCLAHLVRGTLWASLAACADDVQTGLDDDASADEATGPRGHGILQQAAGARPVTASDEVKVGEIAAHGEACVGGTLNIFSNRDGVQFFFSSFELQRTGDEAAASRSSSCGFQVILAGIPGRQLQIEGLTALGTSYLPVGAKASYAVTYGFEGAPLKASSTLPAWTGPALGGWQHSFTDVQSAWSACGGPTNLVLDIPLTLESASFAALQLSNLILDVAQRPCGAEG